MINMMTIKSTTRFFGPWMCLIAFMSILHVTPWMDGPGTAVLARHSVSLSPSERTRKAQVTFGAYYTRITSDRPFERFSRTDAHADVVVQVSGAGGRLVFWRGSSYLPFWEATRTVHVPEVVANIDGSSPESTLLSPASRRSTHGLSPS